MKVALACAFLAVAVTASEPNKKLGAALGDLLAANAGDAAFEKAYAAQVQASMPVVVNPAVSEAIRAANKKASFLKSPSHINLHVMDSTSYAEAASKHLAYQQRKKLMNILKH